MKEITVSSSGIEITFTADLIPDRAAIAAYVGGYGYALDAIDREKMENIAQASANGQGYMTPAGILTDYDEILDHLIETERERIIEEQDEIINALMGQINDIRSLVQSIEAGDRVGNTDNPTWAFAERVDGQALYDGYDPEHYVIRWHEPMMPAHLVDRYGDLDSLTRAMQEIAPLTEWQVIELED